MSPDDLVAYAVRLDELGYGACWLPDLFGREIYVVAGHVLAHTNRIRVATGIAHIYARDAISTAQAARTLSELYPGRFILGLGVSHPIAAEIRGHRWTSPVEKLQTYLEEIAVAPIHSPAPAQPALIFIAAHGPKLLALAATHADGANTYLMPPAHTEQARDILGPDKALNVVLPCCLCDNTEHARSVARRGLRLYLDLPAYRRQWRRFGFDETDYSDGGSDRLVDTCVAWGSESALHERIAEHIEAGATEVEVIPYNPEKGRAPAWPLLEALAP